MDKEELKQVVHDIVGGQGSPITAHGVFQIVKSDYSEVTFDEVKEAVKALAESGFLVDSAEKAYFAVG